MHVRTARMVDRVQCISHVSEKNAPSERKKKVLSMCSSQKKKKKNKRSDGHAAGRALADSRTYHDTSSFRPHAFPRRGLPRAKEEVINEVLTNIHLGLWR
jgi:hypothetical protein